MNPLEEKLVLIESRLQYLVEGTAERLFANKPLAELLAHRLMDGVKAGLQALPDGGYKAPEQLVLSVSSAEVDLFRNPHWLTEIEGALRGIAAGQGICFPDRPFIVLESLPELHPGELRVRAANEYGGVSQTTDVATSIETQYLPTGFFLIVDGTQIFPLEHPVINLGRRPDNHIVIDDVRVSRIHAQLRCVRGKIVIFDLESSGGTFVNGRQVIEQVLHPGDVISLAGVPLVFGQDSADLTQTQEISLSE